MRKQRTQSSCALAGFCPIMSCRILRWLIRRSSIANQVTLLGSAFAFSPSAVTDWRASSKLELSRVVSEVCGSCKMFPSVGCPGWQLRSHKVGIQSWKASFDVWIWHTSSEFKEWRSLFKFGGWAWCIFNWKVSDYQCFLWFLAAVWGALLWLCGWVGWQLWGTLQWHYCRALKDLRGGSWTGPHYSFVAAQLMVLLAWGSVASYHQSCK